MSVSMSIFLIFSYRYDLIDASYDEGIVCVNLKTSLPMSVHGLAVPREIVLHMLCLGPNVLGGLPWFASTRRAGRTPVICLRHA